MATFAGVAAVAGGRQGVVADCPPGWLLPSTLTAFPATFANAFFLRGESAKVAG